MKIKIKTIISCFTVMALLIVQVCGMSISNAVTSADYTKAIQGHYAEATILEWIQNGFLEEFLDGKAPENLRIDENISRGEFVALFNRIFKPVPPGDAVITDFIDVKADHRFFEDITLAAKVGYITGYSDGSFKPDNNITRQDAGAILSRFLNLGEIVPPNLLDAFSDKASIKDYALNHMSALVELNMFRGDNQNRLLPLKPISVVESIVLLDRAYKLVNKHTGITGRIYMEGKPAANCSVIVTKGDDYTILAQAQTDSNGDFTVKLEAGTYSVIACLGNNTASKAAVPVRNGFLTYVKLGLTSGRQAKGLVLDVNGSKIGNVTIYFKSDLFYPVKTNSDGEFEIALPVNQEYEIFYEKSGKLVSAKKFRMEPGSEPFTLGNILTQLGSPYSSGGGRSTPSDNTPPLITILNEEYNAETNVIQTTADSITVSGTAQDNSGISSAKYSLKPYGAEAIAGDLNGTTSWSIVLNPEIGTNELTLEFTDSRGNTSAKVVYINRISQDIMFGEKVKAPDEETLDDLSEDIVACWFDDKGTEDWTDDQTVVLIKQDSCLVSQLESGELVVGDIFLIPQSQFFITGFTGQIAGHGDPRENEDYPLALYPADEYEEVFFVAPQMEDLLEDDLSLDFSGGIDPEDPIAFAILPNGTDLQVNGQNAELRSLSRSNSIMAMSNDRYPSPGWQPQELFKVILPTLSVDSANKTDILIQFEDVVIYDKDGNKETENDTITLSGKHGIEDLYHYGGLEWHPNFAPWDLDLLPQQIISKTTYKVVNELEVKYKMVEIDTKDLVKKLNQGFENKTELMGINLEGVKFKDKIVLGTFGLRIAAPPVTGSIKTVAGQSKLVPFNPILLFMIVLHLDGSVSGEIALTFSNNSYNEKGFNLQKENFTGAYGSLSSNRGQRHYDLPFNRALEVYDLCAKSASSKNEKPSKEIKLSGTAEASIEAGGGAAAGIMIGGIMPAMISGIIYGKAQAKLEGEVTWDSGGFDLDGNGSASFLLGAKVEAAFRLIAKTFLGDAGIELEKSWNYVFFQEGITSASVSGTVYKSDSDRDNTNNPVLSGAKVTLLRKNYANAQPVTCYTGSDGKYSFSNVFDGEYTLRFEKEGFTGYSVDIDVEGSDLTQDAFLDTPYHNNLSGKVTIADTDTDSTNNLPLEGAKVTLRKLTGSQPLTKTVFTDSQGQYAFSGLPAGVFEIEITKQDYITSRQVLIIRENQPNYYNAVIESISNAYTGNGRASGVIRDMVTGMGVAGLTLKVRSGINNIDEGEVLETITTTAGGSYETGDLPAGHYCIEIIDERQLDNEIARYLSNFINVKILGGMTIAAQNGVVTTSMSMDQLRIVLTWGANPSDLDSHLTGPAGEGERFHIYYSNKTYVSNNMKMADLDLDDTTSYGPETVTIYYPEPGIYRYYIHNFTDRNSQNNSNLANSGATVKVYLGSSSTPIYTFNVPNQDGTVWAVFEYDSTTQAITPINEMYYESEPMVIGFRMMSIDPIQEDIMRIGQVSEAPKNPEEAPEFTFDEGLGEQVEGQKGTTATPEDDEEPADTQEEGEEGEEPANIPEDDEEDEEPVMIHEEDEHEEPAEAPEGDKEPDETPESSENPAASE